MQLAKHLRYGKFSGGNVCGEHFSALAEGVESVRGSKFIHICKQLSSAGC